MVTIFFCLALNELCCSHWQRRVQMISLVVTILIVKSNLSLIFFMWRHLVCAKQIFRVSVFRIVVFQIVVFQPTQFFLEKHPRMNLSTTISCYDFSLYCNAHKVAPRGEPRAKLNRQKPINPYNQSSNVLFYKLTSALMTLIFSCHVVCTYEESNIGRSARSITLAFCVITTMYEYLRDGIRGIRGDINSQCGSDEELIHE